MRSRYAWEVAGSGDDVEDGRRCFRRVSCCRKSVLLADKSSSFFDTVVCADGVNQSRRDFSVILWETSVGLKWTRKLKFPERLIVRPQETLNLPRTISPWQSNSR